MLGDCNIYNIIFYIVLVGLIIGALRFIYLNKKIPIGYNSNKHIIKALIIFGFDHMNHCLHHELWDIFCKTHDSIYNLLHRNASKYHLVDENYDCQEIFDLVIDEDFKTIIKEFKIFDKEIAKIKNKDFFNELDPKIWDIFKPKQYTNKIQQEK